MDIAKLFMITKKLQKQAIGEPLWVPEKRTFEYPKQNIEVLVILKIIRAAQGVQSMYLLCTHGLLIDMCALYRCVDDCSAEIAFLLENYPKTSTDADQFIKAFFEATADNHLNAQTPYVTTRKIRSSMVRSFGSHADQSTHETTFKIYKTFSGYIHANYVHIMQIYGGNPARFNVEGVSSIQERNKHMELVKVAHDSVLLSIGLTAQKFGLKDICREAMGLL